MPGRRSLAREARHDRPQKYAKRAKNKVAVAFSGVDLVDSGSAAGLQQI